ncbi:Argininosuccinate lyase [Variovorax sp. SRS16]|uniref:SGNH/GDSL hydrolase family protein n=1 Tax=Variovorax sp. SRS16 TaxID=282217 RepID=UPI001318606B|nr:SGNH/GDSL hydrolase family protein [Variovorax sp. SRS16]VTU27550.1 Argininosuccinate lyase [Variovorax sp. SRS16]
MKTAIRLAALALTLLGAFASQAQTATDAPPSPAYLAAQTRWQGELAAFARADQKSPPGRNGVLFVGSSTIRFWTHVAQDFSQQPVVINRGFGGSTMADCSLFAHELVVRYQPREVLVYAGDNDLAEGRTPMQVLESFASFANTVRTELPDTRIAFISVKPSPSREKLMPQIRETNHIIEAYLSRLPNSEYIDVFTPMLDADGRLRPELFRSDMLHLNDDGYRLWQSVIGPHLPPPAMQADAAAR